MRCYYTAKQFQKKRMVLMRLYQIVLAACAVFLSIGPIFAQSADSVLVVINEASPASIEIGGYYAQKRAIPKENVIRIRTGVADTIERADYERQVEVPIAAWLTRNFAQDRILYIVL